jgi:hypothetical protein
MYRTADESCHITFHPWKLDFVMSGHCIYHVAIIATEEGVEKPGRHYPVNRVGLFDEAVYGRVPATVEYQHVAC